MAPGAASPCTASPFRGCGETPTRQLCLPETPVNRWGSRRGPSLLGRPSAEVLSQRSRIMGPQTHRLPGRVMWLITILTALSMAVLNFFTILAIEYSVRLKFGIMQLMIQHSGVAMGVIILTLISMAYSLLGVSLIECFAPSCGGSGLPENKCFLNGSNLPGFYTKRTLRVRVATVILSNAAGFPVGREGPTVVIGSNVAFLISEAIAQPWVKEWVDVSRHGSTPALIVDEERFAEATRISCAVGGACGMAMIFNAPFGGFLYMFEEMTSVSWPWELTFRVFVATMTCAMASYGLLRLCGKSIFEFVIFAWLPQNQMWSSQDLPLFILMSAMLGVLTSYHTRGCLYMAGVRQRAAKRLRRFQPFAKMTETVAYCACCALVSAGTALLAGCADYEDAPSNLVYVVFNCGEGQYNPVASLLVNTSHSSVKFLFSGNNTGEIRHQAALSAFVAYYALNVLLTGLPVPGGAFTATMLLGGLFGRATGEFAAELGLIDTASGIYAVVGSAAMLCGFKQMTLAVVLIVVECVNNLNLAPAVMLAVTVSMAVNWALNERGHDEEQIRRRKLPFMEGEAPRELDDLVALSVRDDIPQAAILPPMCRLEAMREALAASSIRSYPVVDEADTCVGIVARLHLEAVLEALSTDSNSNHASFQSYSVNGSFTSFGTNARSRAFLQDPFEAKEDINKTARDFRRMISGELDEDGMVPLDLVMDPTPLTLMEDMPAPRLYPLFAKAGERAACVVSRDGKFRGIITRANLIAAARDPPPSPQSSRA